MTTWREVSWEALARGERIDVRWPDYAEYAGLRAKGLRREALEAADRCAAMLAEGDEVTRWDFTEWLCTEILWPAATRSMILPHSLEGTVGAALWKAHGRGEARATVWLVQWFPVQVMASLGYRTDAIGEFLRRAVAKHPGAVGLSTMLAEHLVAWVRMDSADVANGRYDGDPVADLDRLAEAESLLQDNAPILADVERQRQIVSDWISARG